MKKLKTFKLIFDLNKLSAMRHKNIQNKSKALLIRSFLPKYKAWPQHVYQSTSYRRTEKNPKLDRKLLLYSLKAVFSFRVSIVNMQSMTNSYQLAVGMKLKILNFFSRVFPDLSVIACIMSQFVLNLQNFRTTAKSQF